MIKKLITLIFAISLLTFTACSNSQTPATGNTTPDPSAPLTMTELAKHNTKEDCWMLIDGNIYDVTSFISAHPGGDTMLQGCGIDATSLYTGNGHSQTATAMLENYLLGPITNQ